MRDYLFKIEMEQLTEVQTNVLPIGTPQNGSMGSQISFSELLGQPFEYLQNSVSTLSS